MVLDSTYSYMWDSETNAWVIFWRYVYTYDANGNQTEEIEYLLDLETNDWVNFWRQVGSVAPVKPFT